MINLILENVRSVYNTASIFRTADAAGVSEIYLCGTTPAPTDRFGRERGDFMKVSLGAEKTLSWSKKENAEDVVKSLRNKGFKIVSVEQNKNSENYKQFQESEDVVYVFGNEVRGVSPEVLSLSDEVIEIPMKGHKESLNVSVAVGVILFS